MPQGTEILFFPNNLISCNSNIIFLVIEEDKEVCDQCVTCLILYTGSPGIGPGPQGPFQRAMSMDGKPPGGPGGAGRRPMLIKQENMMGSPDGYPGNMGVC